MTIAEILQQAKALSGQERKEICDGIDAQEYVNQLRSEWDEHP